MRLQGREIRQHLKHPLRSEVRSAASFPVEAGINAPKKIPRRFNELLAMGIAACVFGVFMMGCTSAFPSIYLQPNISEGALKKIFIVLLTPPKTPIPICHYRGSFPPRSVRTSLVVSAHGCAKGKQKSAIPNSPPWLSTVCIS